MALKIWAGPTNALVLQATSPTLVFSDRVRATDVYKGIQLVCAYSMLARGTFGSGPRLGWVVNQCTVTNERGNIGTLTIEWEAGGSAAIQPLPAGECRIEPQELYPRVERNPYFAALLPKNVKIAYCAAHLALEAGVSNDTFYKDLFGVPAAGSTAAVPPKVYGADGFTPDATQLALAQSLFSKLSRGEETYYLAGWRYTDILYSYALPPINRGGVIQSPNGIGRVAISDSSIGGIRLADLVEPAGVNGSMWKVTRTWLGGPQGHWDPDLYQ